MRRAIYLLALAATLCAHAVGQTTYFQQGKVYETMELQWDVCGGTYPPAGVSETTASPDNPFLDYRFEVEFTSPTDVDHFRPGFYAADGSGGDSGCKWAVRFTPDEVGEWDFTATLYRGTDANVATTGGTVISTTSGTVNVTALLFGGSEEVFRKRGAVTPHATHPYMVHQDGTSFLKHGMNSPENFLAYKGFDYTRDYGGTAFYHEYAAHSGHWNTGDPDWSASVLPAAGGSPTTTSNSGKNIIGAIRYLAENHCNGLYFLPLNLGGDGKDTHPFVQDSVAGHSTPIATSTATHYDVGRMRQWFTMMDFAQDLGVFLDLVLFEEELANIQLLADSTGAAAVGDLTTKRKLYLKQMAAYFGHLPGLRFILCEENGKTSMNSAHTDREFTAAELNAMAAYLESLQSWPTMVTVHQKNNAETPFKELLSGGALPSWCDSLSMQIGPGSSGWEDIAPFFEFCKWKYGGVCHLDEIGDDQYGASDQNKDDIRKHYTWDVLLSGGQIAWYNGYNHNTYGGDLKLEDFTNFKVDFFDTAWVAVDTINDFSFWEGQDLDRIDNLGVSPSVNVRTSIVSGAAASDGEPEVMWIEDEAYIVYYETVDQGGTFTPGTIDLSDQAAASWKCQWKDARTGTELGAFFFVTTGGTVNLSAYTNALTAANSLSLGPDVFLVIWKT